MLNVALNKIKESFFQDDKQSHALNIDRYNSLTELLCWRFFDPEGEVYINTNSYGFMLEVSPLLGASEDTIKMMTNMITEGMPDNATVQILCWASPDTSNYFDVWSSGFDNGNNIHQEISKKRKSYFDQHHNQSLFKDTSYLIREFRIFLTVSFEGSYDLNNYLQLKQIRNAFSATLKQLGAESINVKPERFIHFISELLNGGEVSEQDSWNEYETIHTQLIQPEYDYAVSDDRITVNPTNKEIRCFSAVKFPEIWAQWQVTNLLGDLKSNHSSIPCPFLSVFTFTIEDQDKYLQKAFIKSTRATQQAETYWGRFMPDIARKAKDWHFVADKLNQGQRVVKAVYQTILFADKDNADYAEQSLKSLYSKNGWQIAKDKFIQLQSFLSCLPFHMSNGLKNEVDMLGRFKTMVSWSCANLMPLQGEWRGINKPGVLLFGRRGQPFLWNPFENKGGNYNVAVIGKSGSGKSVFMQELVATLSGTGGKVIIIDDGYSFMNSSQLQGGEFIEFTSDRKICINPFSMIDDAKIETDTEYKQSAMTLINSIIQQMCRSETKTDDIENSHISKAVMSCWEKTGSKTTITHIRDFLLQINDRRANDLGLMLQPYTKEGLYRDYFEGECNIDINAHLIVFELSEIKNRKELQSLVLMILMFLASEEMYRSGRQQRVSIVIDEAWDLLNGQGFKGFIEGIARRGRKYSGNLITGTQSVNDYYKNPAAEAAFENTDWVCCLSQKKESIETLKQTKRLSINDQVEEQLKSLRMVDQQYSEIMICSQDAYHIGRLILDPWSMALYSSKGEDFSRIQDLKEQGMSLDKAIELVAQSISEERS